MGDRGDKALLPLSAVSVVSSLLAVWTLRLRQQQRLDERRRSRPPGAGEGAGAAAASSSQAPASEPPPPPPPPPPPQPPQQPRPQPQHGGRQWAALEVEAEDGAHQPLAPASNGTPVKPARAPEDPPTTPRNASSAKSRPPRTLPKLQAAREAASAAAAEAAAAAMAMASDTGPSSAASTPTHKAGAGGLGGAGGGGGGGGGGGSGAPGESTAMRVNRSLSEGPLPEVQERVLAALAACPGMAEVGSRRIELLVHNVSHKDMVLSLAPLLGPTHAPQPPLPAAQQQQGQQQQGFHRRMSSATSEELVLCRPKFSLFQPVSEALYDYICPASNPSVDGAGACATATFPVYTRECEEGDYDEEDGEKDRGEPVTAGMLDTRPAGAGGGGGSSSPERQHRQPSASLERPSPPRRERAYTLRRQAPSAPELPVGFDLARAPFPLSYHGQGGGNSDGVAGLSDFRVRRDDGRKLAARRARMLLEAAAAAAGAGNGDGKEASELEEEADAEAGADAGPVGVEGVYFPLLATILPKWRAVVHGGTAGAGEARPPQPPPLPHQHPQVFKIVFLVSGVGMPRDPSSSATGNSTEGTARLIEAFLARHYPDVAVVRVHSTTNIFRYDENIAFVKNELLPLVEFYRDGAAERWGTGWRHRYRITISFADGSPARISAINAALRPYRPSFMHTWELKTFWHHAKMCLDDVECHSFEDIDTAPPVPLAAADARAQLVAREMLRFKQEVLAHYRAGRCADLASFWLRKTKKPVLAVLLVQKPGEEPVLYRGCNMEVSMPTGSLCAERNAIGSALAADLTLRRRDLKIVAVLSLSFKPPTTTTTTTTTLVAAAPEPRRALDGAFAAAEEAGSGGKSREPPPPPPPQPPQGERLLRAAVAKLQAGDGAMAEGTAVQQQQSTTTAAAVGGNGNGEAGAQAQGDEEEVGEGSGFAGASPPRVTVIRSYSVKDLHHLHLHHHHHTGSTAGNSRRGSLDVNEPAGTAMPAAEHEGGGLGGGPGVSGGSTGSGLLLEAAGPLPPPPVTLTIAVDSEDLNPLKPCGACMEWLKKIAEKNPEFRVATFTDEACRGIYTEFISTS